MRSLISPLKLDADSKRLNFVTELDRMIDDVRPVRTGEPDVNVLTIGRRTGSLLCVGSQ